MGRPDGIRRRRLWSVRDLHVSRRTRGTRERDEHEHIRDVRGRDAGQGLLDELVGVVHVLVRLTPEEQRLLRDDPDQVRPLVRQQVENAVIGQSALRLVGAIERRMEESLELDTAQLAQADWDQMAEQVYQAVELGLNRRRERLMGNGAGPASGQLYRDLDSAIAKISITVW